MATLSAMPVREKRRTGVRRLAATALLLVIGCGQQPSAPAPPLLQPKVPGIRLVVVVVVDQLGWEMLERFRPALRGGLARLLDGGIVFTQATQRHASPASATGNATLVTGLTPRHHGIVGDTWFDRNARREVDSDREPVTGEVAPTHLLATALPDWVRQRDPWGATFSVGGRDRSAVMLGGKLPTGVFWFDTDAGGFVTSHSYHRAPRWVRDFNRRPILRERFGTLWQPLPLPPGVPAARLGVMQVDGAGLPPPFPHSYGEAISSPGPGFYRAIADSPVIDEYLAAFARELVTRERLGTGRHLDYLAISFTGSDAVGDVYGPHSPEALDAVLRLDRVLGDLLAFLDERVGREHLLVALTAAHGAAPLPERQRRLGLPGARESPAGVACVQSMVRRLDDAYGKHEWFAADLYLDLLQVARSRVPRAELDRKISAWLAACPAVARVWTRTELSPDRPARDPWQTLYRASYHPARSPDFVIQWRPGFVDRLAGTTHDAPYPYDTHVPLMLRLPGAAARTIDDPVAAADLAPTLASLLGLRTPLLLDGRDLAKLILAMPSTAGRVGRPAPRATPAATAAVTPAASPSATAVPPASPPL